MSVFQRAALRVGVLAALLLMSGCGTTTWFKADSVVTANGSLERRARLSRGGSACTACREYLQQHYELAPAGRWQVDPEPFVNTRGEPDEYERQWFELRTRHPGGVANHTDFIRKGSHSGRAANRVDLTARNFFFVKTFIYEERFHDPVNMTSLRTHADELYGLWVKAAATALAHGLAPHVDRDQASSVIESATRDWLEDLLSELAAHGLSHVNSDEAQAAADAVFDDEVLIPRLARALADRRPADMPPQEWQARIAAALDFDVAETDPPFGLSDEESKRIEQGLFGAHGFRLFNHYRFEVRLKLPGDVYQSNATTTEEDRLLWAFNSDDFVIHDYVIAARSRVFFPQRIIAGLALIGGLGLGLGATFTWRQRKPRGDEATRTMP